MSTTPFAWSLLWRGLASSEALKTEQTLLDMHVAKWQRRDSAAVGASPKDTVHSITVEGDGPRELVMLHGMGTGSGIFFRNLAPLSESGLFKRTHAVDWRGAGLSGRPPWTAASHDEARDFLVDGLEAWRAENGIERMVLLGHSMGGIVAAHYAAKHGDRVDHLVLCGPAGVERRPRLYEEGDSVLYDTATSLWNRGYHPAAVVRFLGPWGKRLVEAYARRRFDGGRCPLSDGEAHALGAYLHAVNSLPGSAERSMNQLLGPIAQPVRPLAPLVEALDCPVTFIYGKADWMQPASGAAATRSRLERGKDGACVVLPGGGHYIFVEDPPAFLDALLARLEP